MLQTIQNYFRRRQRAKINRELDHVYADMRAATERARALKRHAEHEEAKTLADLAKHEQALIARAKRLDAQEILKSIPTRSARSW